MSQHRLQALLEPKSIAVVGASPREKSFARNVMNGCLSAGFDGGALALLDADQGAAPGMPVR